MKLPRRVTILLLLAALLAVYFFVPPARESRAANYDEDTPSISSVSASGTVAAGAKSVEFVFSSDFTGTLLGVAYAGSGDSSQRFVALPGHKLAAIAYTRSAGSIRIVEVR